MIERLTEEQIKEINETINYGDQGLYDEPYGIRNGEKRKIIYMRWNSGGVSGGSCWESSNPRPYENDEPPFKILDVVLKKLCGDKLSYSDMQNIKNLENNSSETDYGYYGNYDEYKIKYIILEELYNYLEKLDCCF